MPLRAQADLDGAPVTDSGDSDGSDDDASGSSDSDSGAMQATDTMHVPGEARAPAGRGAHLAATDGADTSGKHDGDDAGRGAAARAPIVDADGFLLVQKGRGRRR